MKKITVSYNMSHKVKTQVAKAQETADAAPKMETKWVEETLTASTDIQVADDVAEDILTNQASSKHVMKDTVGLCYRLLKALAEMQGCKYTGFNSAVDTEAALVELQAPKRKRKNKSKDEEAIAA